MFIHFGPNTFTNQEWGTGLEDPKENSEIKIQTRAYYIIGPDSLNYPRNGKQTVRVLNQTAQYQNILY